jgi:hypothetical protein
MTTSIYMSHIFTCRIFTSSNKCWKFPAYLVAIWDRWGPRYGPKCHLQARPGPMNDCAPAHLLLHSGVAPVYLCGVPVWRAPDCYRAASDNEWAFAHVSPLHSWPMSTMFQYKLVWLLHQFVVSFVARINQQRNNGVADWRVEHATYLALWELTGSSQ